MSETVNRYRSIITHLALVVTGILVLALLVASSLALLGQQRQLNHALETKAATLVQFMAQVTPLSILSLNFVDMNNNVTKVVLTDDEAVYAVILNAQGLPLVDFFKDPDQLVTTKVRALVKKREPLAAIQMMKQSGRILEVTAPVSAGERRIGSATLGFSTDKMRHALMMQMIAIGVVMILIICVSIALLRVVLQRILHPVQTLTAAAAQISAGDLNVVLTGAERADELGGLARAFDSMAGQLRELIAGLKQREDDLCRINLLQRTILDHAAYGIISTDPEGIVRSFNRAAERLLGYAAADVVGNVTPALWHDPEEMAQRALQLSAELDETVPPGFDVFTARTRRNLLEENEWTFIRNDGMRVPVLLSVTALRDESGLITGFVGMTYDLTERKRAEQERREIEERYRQFFESSPVSLWEESFTLGAEYFKRLRAAGVTDFRGFFESHPEAVDECVRMVEIRDVNKATLELLGAKSKDELVAGLSRIFTKETFPLFREEIITLAEGGLHFEAETVHKTLSGRDITVLIRMSVVPGYEETLERILVSLMDITERTKAEESLRQLNRQLRAISDCNQTLMRATDEQTLLDDICRIICGQAGYRMAWVGYAEQDEDRTIRPVAFAGVEEGYIAEARLSWADTERGRGPAGMAIRNGTTITVQDLSLSQEFAPWLESALKRSYRSGIWLPLTDENMRVFGVLLIYSAEVNAFSSEEIRLLEELAGDLAFGITVLRGRIERRKTEQRLTLLDFALNNVHEEAYLINEQANFAYVNEQSCRALGYSRAELLGMNVTDVDPDFPGERWHQHWHDIRERGSITFEGRHKARAGSIYPVEISANYFEYGGMGYNLALVRDITERKRAEEALQEERKLFIGGPNVAFKWKAAEGWPVEYVSPNIVDQFGYTPEDFISGKRSS